MIEPQITLVTSDAAGDEGARREGEEVEGMEEEGERRGGRRAEVEQQISPAGDERGARGAGEPSPSGSLVLRATSLSLSPVLDFLALFFLMISA